MLLFVMYGVICPNKRTSNYVPCMIPLTTDCDWLIDWLIGGGGGNKIFLHAPIHTINIRWATVGRQQASAEVLEYQNKEWNSVLVTVDIINNNVIRTPPPTRPTRPAQGTRRTEASQWSNTNWCFAVYCVPSKQVVSPIISKSRHKNKPNQSILLHTAVVVACTGKQWKSRLNASVFFLSRLSTAVCCTVLECNGNRN